MASNQKLLQPPKLPLPDVELTLQRYLDAVETFTPTDQLVTTKMNVQNLLEDKQKIQAIMELLQQKFDKEENWVYQWWLEDMYLRNMLPLPVNSNPGWVFPKQKFDTIESMLSYMTKLIIGLCNFKQNLEAQTLPEELAGGRSGGPKMPLCMIQYERLLNAYRKPGNGQDSLECTKIDPRNDEHVIVMVNTYLYKMPIKVDSKWLSFQTILKMLKHIHEEALKLDELPMNQRAPLLTSQARNVWFEARNQLLETEENVQVLESIESCLFIVCLDHAPQNPTDVERSQKDMFKQMLTGMGTRFNGSNRWFDKTIQLIVSMDGGNGMCYEHTASEGVAVVTAVLNMFKFIETIDDTFGSENEVKDAPFTKLEIKVSNALMDKIQEAAIKLDALDVDTDDEVFTFTDFGKSFIKTCNCSPDAFLQMSLQLAYYKIYNELCSTYESASTRRFHGGRVDSIRASHPEALVWTKAMEGNGTKEVIKELFKDAIVKQTKVMKENIFGEGVDIPLLGIRRAAEELWPSEPLPMFKDPTYDLANKFKLSTSQVPINLNQSYMGYGAVVPDGYGVSYNLQNDEIIFAICSFFSCETTNSRRFATALSASLREMRELFN